jgi:cytochrome d ubiquinol oxidase subunit I
MDPVLLARWQFAITTIYHFLFVPITLGSSLFLAVLETRYVATGDEMYKSMVKFWSKIFLIFFSMGVVTGIVQEFHFGLNWSEYSRFVGDVIGVPIALDSLLAFFLESTFIGIWIFGWDKLSKKAHAATIWLVAIGAHISAFWILAANSFMHNPVGFTIRNSRAEMVDFGAIIKNPYVWHQYPHVITAGITIAGFLYMSFSAWQLLQNKAKTREFFLRSFKLAAAFALIGSVLVGLIGHAQGQFLAKIQPMKVMAMEGHWETEQPGSFTVIGGIDQKNQENPWEIKVPYMLSFLLFNDFSSEVPGLIDLQAEAEALYGPGNYIPPVAISFWSLRVMIGFGLLMILISGLAVLWARNNTLEKRPWFLKVLIFSGFVPTIASIAGWIIAETGRYPWIVRGLQKIENAVSPNVGAGNIIFSLVTLTLLYAVLIVISVSLALKFGTSDPVLGEEKGE